MSETKLKTVGDCVNLCKSAGIEISHLDDNLFETAGTIDDLLGKISQLEKENAELKKRQDEYVWMTRDEIKVYSDLQQELMGQSLAEHDRQVVEDAVVDFCCWLIENGGPIPVEKLQVYVNRFLEQLKEQE